MGRRGLMSIREKTIGQYQITPKNKEECDKTHLNLDEDKITNRVKIYMVLALAKEVKYNCFSLPSHAVTSQVLPI